MMDATMNYESRFESEVVDPVEPRARNRRWIIIATGALIVLLVVAFLVMHGRGKPAEAGAGTAGGRPDQQAPAVTVVSPGNNQVERQITATGSLSPKREIPVGVVGEGGQVARVLVDANSWVKQGQTLVTIDRSVQVQQIAQLQAQVGVARSDLALAQNELDRSLQLVGRGFVSKADVDRKTAARDGAAARLRAAQAAVRESQARTARLDIRAPVSGVILARNVNPGQVVTAGSPPLFTMAEGGQLELQARLAEVDLARIRVGAPATVTPAGTDRSFSGQVWQIAPVIDPQTRLGVARIALPFNPALRPGGFATAVLNAGSSTAPVLPESAIQSDNRGSFVYIVGPNNKVQRRDVTTGDVTGQGIIVTKGLTGNERVVLYAGGFLNPGETVTPKLARPGS